MTRYTGALIGVACAMTLLSACGSSGSGITTEEKGPTVDAASGDSSSAASASQGQIADFGFGQNGEYVQAVALVKNLSDHAGQTVTVSVNFLDASGNILDSESQVDYFAYPNETTAIEIFGDLGSSKAKVAKAQPTLVVSDDGTFAPGDVALPPVDATLTQQYGQWTANVPVKNPSSSPLSSPFVGIACYNKAGQIVGGGFDYPTVVPSNGQIIDKVDVTASGAPAKCRAYFRPAIS